MYEVGLYDSLLDLIRQRAAGRRVAGVRLRVGARHGIGSEAFTAGFATAANGTIAAGATVDVVVAPVALQCRNCGLWSRSVDSLVACTACGAADVDISGGDDLVLDSVQFET